MQLTSDAFEEIQQIPLCYTKDGGNISPPLQWSGVPEHTREFVLLFAADQAGEEEIATVSKVRFAGRNRIERRRL